MLLRKNRLIILSLVSPFIFESLYAQDFSEYEGHTQAPIIQEIEADGNISVNIPEGLNAILSFNETGNSVQPTENKDQFKAITKVGYRVQVFDDNNVRTAKSQAQERKQMIENRFPEFHAYVQFNSPYWRVKVGDFRTRSEAEAAMGAIRAAFPSISSQLRVVRDKINSR